MIHYVIAIQLKNVSLQTETRRTEFTNSSE
jgi:hypothetical protein